MSCPQLFPDEMTIGCWSSVVCCSRRLLSSVNSSVTAPLSLCSSISTRATIDRPRSTRPNLPDLALLISLRTIESVKLLVCCAQLDLGVVGGRRKSIGGPLGDGVLEGGLAELVL